MVRGPRFRFTRPTTHTLELLRDGKIKPMVAERMPLTEARRAQELLGLGGVKGKLVLICNSRPTRITELEQSF